jgi:hypothetical protein
MLFYLIPNYLQNIVRDSSDREKMIRQNPKHPLKPVAKCSSSSSPWGYRRLNEHVGNQDIATTGENNNFILFR